MSEVNEGVQIILNRMESNPEEFFGDSTRWAWMFKETMREVMTEQEKAALHAGLVKVRRLEITAKAVATVMPSEEEEEDMGESYKWQAPKTNKTPPPKKMVINRAQAEMIKKFNGGQL